MHSSTFIEDPLDLACRIWLVPSARERLSRLVALMRSRGSSSRPVTPPKSAWGKNGERDEAILSRLERGMNLPCGAWS